MGLALTILYVIIALFSPASLYPQLTTYRLELWIAVIALLTSLPNVHRSKLLTVPQTYLMFGLLIAVGWSMVVNHWTGGALLAWDQFAPSAIVLYLVLLNCTSMLRLRILAVSIVFAALIVAIYGALQYHSAPYTSLFVLVEHDPQGDLFRLRGLGFLNDPNDLAQFLTLAIATLGIAWRHRKFVWNLLVVLIPMAVLGYGTFLTKSRGAVVGVAVMLLLLLRSRFGRVGSIAITSLAVFGLVFLNFGIGRGIADESSSNRLQAWGAGIVFLKSNPIFGIGYGQFADRFEITAHNSFILCAAELGLFGYFFWMGLLVFSIAGLNKLLRRAPVDAGSLRRPAMVAMASANSGFTSSDEQGPVDYGSVQAALNCEADDDMATRLALPVEDRSEELRRWAKFVRIALAGFLTAAWFLSRAYAMTLYLYLGIAVALKRIADENNSGGHSQADSNAAGKLIFTTVGLEIISVLLLYIIVLIRPV
jgi:hypothetical protein